MRIRERTGSKLAELEALFRCLPRPQCDKTAASAQCDQDPAMISAAKHGLHSVSKVTKQAAKGDFHKLTEIQDKAATALRQRLAGLGGDGLLDENLRTQHERLASLHSTYGSLHTHLKHQVERARKTAAALRETHSPLLHLAEAVAPTPRRLVQSTMAVESALARAYDEYASALESALLTPGKAELTALFAEGEGLYSSYLSTVNELAAKQGKEKILGSKAAEPGYGCTPAQQRISELAAKKSAIEQSAAPRMAAIEEACGAAMAYLAQVPADRSIARGPAHPHRAAPRARTTQAPPAP